MMRKPDVDPDKISKNPAYSPDFKIEIHFKDICNFCQPQDSIDQKCDYCNRYMKQDLEYWHIIHSILSKHKQPNHNQGVMHHFKISSSDYVNILSKNIK